LPSFVQLGAVVPMIRASADQLKQAVELQHGGTATHVQSTPVHESCKGQTVWNGAVQVFDLEGSPGGASRAYAWSYGLPDGQRRMLTVLHGGPITGPREAVQSVMAADAESANWEKPTSHSRLFSRYF
jgi:hypothetical protein